MSRRIHLIKESRGLMNETYCGIRYYKPNLVRTSHFIGDSNCYNCKQGLKASGVLPASIGSKDAPYHQDEMMYGTIKPDPTLLHRLMKYNKTLPIDSELKYPLIYENH